MPEVAEDQEPSMEEILASIRRIISEDPPAEGAAAPAEPAKPDDSVLELTDVVAEAPAAPPSAAAPPLEALPPEPVYAMPILTHDDSIPPRVEPLVSAEAAAASKASFASVAAEARRRLARDQPIGNGEATLESIVNDLLRPMLKEWLDANLPELVSRLVAEEIERLSRHTK
jgi:cell pole-organizing protein PopZ